MYFTRLFHVAVLSVFAVFYRTVSDSALFCEGENCPTQQGHAELHRTLQPEHHKADINEMCLCSDKDTGESIAGPKVTCMDLFCGCFTSGEPVGICCQQCPVPKKEDSGGGSCFCGDSQLSLDDGSVIPMKNLKTGQKVMTVETGRRVFMKVKTFLKRQPNMNVTHQTLTTEFGNSVSMSTDHFIFVSKNNNSANMVARTAKSVEPGDYIFSTNTCPDGFCPERVVQISFSLKQGLYVPVTDSGTLVVDGIFSSSHSAVQHDIDHFFVKPFLWFPWLLEPWKQDGYSPVISNLENLGTLLNSNEDMPLLDKGSKTDGMLVK